MSDTEVLAVEPEVTESAALEGAEVEQTAEAAEGEAEAGGEAAAEPEAEQEAADKPKKGKAKKADKPAEAAGVKLVKMTRDKEGPEPHAADVHPDEVDNYAAAGWSKA